jgi:predicted nicotinamide N-methyase
MIVLNGDVAWDQRGNRRVGPAEEQVLTGGFEVIVGDRERARPIPSGDRLRVLAIGLDLGDVRVADGRGRAVQGDAALLAVGRITVDVARVDDQIMWHHRQRVLRARSVTELDDVVLTTGIRKEFEEAHRVVVGAWSR